MFIKITFENQTLLLNTSNIIAIENENGKAIIHLKQPLFKANYKQLEISENFDMIYKLIS